MTRPLSLLSLPLPLQLPYCKRHCHHQQHKTSSHPQVVEACALLPDFASLASGDQTKVHHCNYENHHHFPHTQIHLKGGRSWKHSVRRPEGSSGPRKGSLSGYDSHATRNSGTFSHWIIKFNTFCNNSQKCTQFFCKFHYTLLLGALS